ncbi:MAG: hypothetical protein Q4E12_08415, partial [Coriobacteriia bacterium]|nr:hypothetical protein [Coriobacteriia bacterium]
RPRVGVVGPAALVHDPYLNDNLVAFAAKQGFAAVLAPPEYLVDEDMSYPAALTYFQNEGIQTVLYLNSFRCLKGHIDAYGKQQQLRERFPGLRITVIDFDSESSVLNRQNRIVLTLRNHFVRK